MGMSGEAVTVVGAGYVGLVTAVGLAKLGHRVRLVETRPDRLEPLRAGRVPLHEAGLQAGLNDALADGRLVVSDAPSDVPGLALVCVGTPIGDDGRSDLRQLRSALAALHDRMGPEAILVIRSTLPVGGTRRAVEWAGVPTARIFTNPEFLRQGTAMADFERPTRLVIGRFADADPAAEAAVLGLFEGIDCPRFVVDVEAAEIIKNGANAFLALKLSFANEIAALCEEAGTDVDDVLAGITADPRIGATYMRPSFGFGGSCLPKELATLAVAGGDLGLPMHVTTAAATANRAQQRRFADQIAARLDGLDGRTVAILGLAFKADTDDVRESPALRLAAHLVDGGATVRGFDPAAGANALRELPALELADSPEAAVSGADAVVVGTEWPEFRDLPWLAWRSMMRRPLVFDGRRLLNAEILRSAGYEVLVLGDGRSPATVESVSSVR
jgi:UDPglucose 6-dehydrogenase